MDADLDPVIHQASRLRLMALLHKNREGPFSWLQSELGLTPGNLDGHLQRLADAGYIEHARQLTTSGFRNWVRITRAGDEAFEGYRRALRGLLEMEEP